MNKELIGKCKSTATIPLLERLFFIDIKRVAQVIFNFPDKPSELPLDTCNHCFLCCSSPEQHCCGTYCANEKLFTGQRAQESEFSHPFALFSLYASTSPSQRKMKGNSTFYGEVGKKQNGKAKRNFTPCLSVKYSQSQSSFQPWESKRLNRLENIHFIRKVDTNWITRLSRQSRCSCVGGHLIPILSIPKTFS